MDTAEYCLGILSELGNESRGTFSIVWQGGYYKVAVGEVSYLCRLLTTEDLFEACVAIKSVIAIKEKWYG